ncbi:MAG: type II toxin-antitoxin system HicB family antitoxin [Ruminococcus sp.]|nr:type II toxin-antitoxin system HicB family antitoxin [Ruminococcus sp.]
MKLVYPAVFSQNENTGFTITFPDLPGAVTSGNDIAEAIEMAIDCASGWVLDELEDGKIIPKPTPLNEIILDDEKNFVNLIVVDLDTYAEKYGNKAVRKNCTIPAWLNTISEKENINYSSVLQEALIKKLKLN